MHPFVAGLLDMRHYLGITSAVNIPERLAGRQYLEQFNVGDTAIVIYEWGAKTFSAGAAIRGIPGFFYVACDLYPAEHPRVIAMLASHNMSGTTAVYIQGQIGTAPSWKQLANVLWSTWGLTLNNLRVYLASPECTTVSSAPLNRYSGRDVTNGFAPVSQQAQLDDKTREAVMRTADDIADKLKVRGVQYRFTAFVEQPRSGIAEQVAAIKRRLMFRDWLANHMDNCKFADTPSTMKPSSFFTLGPAPRFSITCRQDGTGCQWRESDGTHIVSIVDYNSSRQTRLADGDVGRSIVHPNQYAALVAMALAGQLAQQMHAATLPDSGPVRMSTASPASAPATRVPVLTARIAGRVARLENTPLTAQQLHQATLHVDPKRVLRSIPSWSGFTIKAASGTVLSAPKIQLRDLRIEGTCDTCARGKLKATGSSHTSHQRDNCRRQRAQLVAQESPEETPKATPTNRRSPRFVGMVNT
jgi:hypothetical protein